MEFTKYFAINSSSSAVSKPKDDISDIISVDVVKHINFNKCFDIRPNNDIICLNIKKFNKVINVLCNFSQFEVLTKFKLASGTELINLINDIIYHKINIPKNIMSTFIIYLIFKKYDSSYYQEFIKLFDFIHIEKYFEQIRSQLNIISLSEFLILFKADNCGIKSEFNLSTYLLNKGEKLLYNPSCFNMSCLKKVLINDNFDLAYMLISLGCNLYENVKSFKDSALFYAMYFRTRETGFKGISEISDKQWNVIKLMLSKCKTLNYQIDPVYLRFENNPVYKVSCSAPVKNESSMCTIIEIESEGMKGCNPFTYALSGYPASKLDYILKSHPEFFEAIKKYDGLYTILTQEYMKFI